MNWDVIQGNWKQAAGKAKEQWAKLADDDVDRVAGRRGQLVGKIQEHCGVAKDEAEGQRRVAAQGDRGLVHAGRGPDMTFEEDIDSFKGRIAEAEAEAKRDVWRVAGREEKYLEAYFMVEALELQLDERLRRHAAGQPPR